MTRLFSRATRSGGCRASPPFFGLCGLIAFAVVWAQLLTEFPKAQLY